MIEKLKKVDESPFPYLDDQGVSWTSRANYIELNILGFCACGDPDASLLYVEKMLLALRDKDRKAFNDDAGQFFLYWADHNEFADHGTSIHGSWLTDKGLELLRDIESVRGELEADDEN